MPEVFANVLTAADGTIATLAAPCTAETLTLTTNAAAPSNLQGGEFRVRVGSEILMVTAGQDGTTWTVTRSLEGTTAAAHAPGAKVRHVLTAGGLAATGGSQIVYVPLGEAPPDPDSIAVGTIVARRLS